MDAFDLEAWRQILIDTLGELITAVAMFLPILSATLVILVVGWLVSKAVELVASRGLRRFGLDEAACRVRLDEVLQRAGVESPPSRIAARILFWVLMLTFVLSAVETLGLTAVTATIDRLIAFLPNVLAAGLLLVLGFVMARFTGSVISSAAAAAQVDQAARLGAATQSLLVVIVAVLALEQLGVDTQLLVTLMSVIVGTLSLTLGVAFALGARPVISHILAGHFVRQSLAVGDSVEIRGRRGTVERVGAVDTLFFDGEKRWSVPNSNILEDEVIR